MARNEFPREAPEEYESPTDNDTDMADEVEKEGRVDHQRQEQEGQGGEGDRQRCLAGHKGKDDVGPVPQSPTQAEMCPIIIVGSPERDATHHGSRHRDPETWATNPAHNEEQGQRPHDAAQNMPGCHSPEPDEPAGNKGTSADGTFAYGGARVESDASTEYDPGAERREQGTDPDTDSVSSHGGYASQMQSNSIDWSSATFGPPGPAHRFLSKRRRSGQ